MPNRILALFMVLSMAFAPFASNTLVTPAEAYVTELDAVLRLVPAVAGAMGGFCLGSSLGMVGKIGGAFIGFEVGKLIGKFLSSTIGSVFTPSYYSPPLWQRLLGYSSPSYGGGYGGAWAPSSTASPAADLGALRDAWIGAVTSYEDALKNGDAASKQARRATLEAAEKAYFDAKGTSK